MKKLDLDLVRTQVGTVRINGKWIDIMEPTLGQKIEHRAMALKISTKLDNLREEEKYSEFVSAQDEWLIQEVRIFLPQLSKEDVQGLSSSQRDQLMKIIFGIEDEKEESKSDSSKKNKKDRPSRGQK